MKRRRVRRAARAVGRGARRMGRYALGAKGSAVEAAGGAGAFYVMRLLSQNFESVNKYWWGPPLATVAVAHVVKKKSPKNAQLASAACGAAGAIAAMAYETNKAAAAQNPEATGFDTGILMMGATGTAPWANNLALDAFNTPMPVIPEAVPSVEPVSSPSVAEAAALGL